MKKRKIKSDSTTERVSKVELEFAKHNAICGERYKTQKDLAL